ncbi:MAG: Tex family protein [Bacillota bacterium]|nr:Tex family protein [Bacillota bacterium]
MNIEIINQIAKELKIKNKQIEETLAMLEEGSTVPFIARYRKERTGGLDEEQIRVIQEQYEYQVNLAKRKEEVLARIETLGRLTEDIVKQVNECTKLVQVEEIYRPYKQKKKTRASIAIENGLEPLAEFLLTLPRYFKEDVFTSYINEKVTSEEEVISQAKDIIAERVSNDSSIRDKVYDSMYNYGRIQTTIKKDAEDENKVYQMYYDYSEKVTTLANHRIMAIDRAEKSKVITVSFNFNEEYIMNWVTRKMIRFPNSPAAPYIQEAIEDGLKRLVYPSVERMIRSELSERAQNSSIELFSMNLEKLLLQPPLKNKTILGFDPAFRTGCKLAVIDESGKKLTVDVIYPHQPNAKVKEAKTKLIKLVKDYKVDVIAIGNGTASRESEAFVAQTIQENHLDVKYTIVSEAGASVYSASKLAIEEFPDLHVEQRSAISIARRLGDPLSELIKIDPQSIGVGQYQHDVPGAKLKERLDFVVEKAVNLVGVNINTASVSLLKNVAGLTNATATNIVKYREENGKFMSRAEIKKVPKIGPKAFEQAAGFLRVEDGRELLDRTSIHPESYSIAKLVLKELSLDKKDMGTSKAKEAINDCDRNQLLESVGCDKYTLNDILDSIGQPLRDYRDQNDAPVLRSDVLELEDLHVGDELEGTVRNVVDFGAFVDIGLHEDGLVHISKMSRGRINHPSDLVSVGDVIKVFVYKIDMEKHKVQLSLLPNA